MKNTKSNYPPIAIGTWSWGTGTNGSKMIFGSNIDTKALKNVYQSALSDGLTLFDTAAIYGKGTSEQLLGKLSHHNDKTIIATKYAPSKFEKNGSLEKSLRESLSRLQRKSVNIFWLHMPVNLEKNVKEMICLHKEGLIENIGVSNCNLEDLKLAQKLLDEEGLHLYGVQNHYSLIYRRADLNGVADWCKKNGTLLYAYMILEQGALTGKKKLPAFSLRGLSFSSRKLKKLQPLVNLMSETGKKYSAKPSQIAIAHALSKGFVPIIGVTKPYQEKELAAALKIHLTDNEVKKLEEAADLTGVSVKGVWEKKM